MIVVGRALLALGLGLAGFGVGGLDEGWWVVAVLFEFSNTCLCSGQLLQCLRQLLVELNHLLAQPSVFASQLDKFFLKLHGP